MSAWGWVVVGWTVLLLCCAAVWLRLELQLRRDAENLRRFDEEGWCAVCEREGRSPHCAQALMEWRNRRNGGEG